MNKQVSKSEVDAFVSNLESRMLKFKQADCPVIHRFGKGVYIRELHVQAGTLIIGHRHKFAHRNVLLKGKVILLNNDGTRVERSAPLSFIAGPGRKVAYVCEDMIWLNIYETNETDIETLETTYLDKSETWLNSEKKFMSSYRAKDIEDYDKLLLEYNLTEKQVRKETENESDQIQMPSGSYKFLISKSNIEGKGVFASANINPLEIIGPARIKDKRTPLGRFTNHSINPNAKMVEFDGYIGLVAIKNINGCLGGFPGEEITVNYRDSLKLVRRESWQQLQQL